MQQNINPENENEKSTETNNTMKQKILKVKDELLSDNHDFNQKIDSIDDEKSCTQSIQSFNQNYEEDFQSYKTTINNQNKSQAKLPFVRNNKSHCKDINLQISRLEVSIVKKPKQRQNKIFLKHTKVENIQKRPKNNIKTQPNQTNQQQFSITKQIFMNQSIMYLRRENEKNIRKIQQLRKIIPVIMKNRHELLQQQIQIQQLKSQIKRILSIEYEFQLDQSKLEIKIQQKQIQHSIKEMFSPKHDKKLLTIINDHTIVPPSKFAVLREQLMNKIRLSCLRQQKNYQLTKKINLYQEVIEKIISKQRLQSFNILQNRRTFLQWDLKRLKNEMDIKIIQEKVQIQSLKDQIRLFDMGITQSFENHQQYLNYPVPGVELQGDDVSKLQPRQNLNKQMQRESKLISQKSMLVQQSKQLKTFVLKRKNNYAFYTPTKNTSKTSHTNKSFLQKQKNLQKYTSLLPSPSFSKLNKSKVNSFEKKIPQKKKKEFEKSNRNLSIRIKQSVFRHEDMSQELQELKL